jgi:hypothetical protein
MQPSTRSAPGPALAPEVPSNNTFSNTLEDDVVTCDGLTTISKTWAPVQQGTGITDVNGNEIFEYVDYDAVGPIEGEMDVENLSNNFYRNFQLFFARGGIKCTQSRANTDFTDLNAEGVGAALRATPYSQVLYYRSQFLFEIAQSLDQNSPIDTVAQDYQIAWSCDGTCQELTNQSASSCRPVYVSEIIFGLKDEPIYYSSPDSSPATFPGTIISNIQNYYSGNCSGAYGCYSSRSKGKSFSPLTKDLYKLMYSQLNFVPKGNANSKVTVTNYGGYNTVARTKTNPIPTTFDRNLPAAAAANSTQAQALKLVTYANQKKLPSSLCDDPEITSDIARDQTLAAKFALFVKGMFQRVPAGQTYTQSESIEVTTTYDANIIPNVETAEMAYLNMIPSAKNKALIEKPFSSITTANRDNPIPDPGYRADALYQQMKSLLRPASWF